MNGLKAVNREQQRRLGMFPSGKKPLDLGIRRFKKSNPSAKSSEIKAYKDKMWRSKGDNL